MFRFELVVHQPNYEEYLILLPPGSPREIVKPVVVSLPDEKMQEVGRWILSRDSHLGDRDRITVMTHPDLAVPERLLLLKEIEGICGKHVYGLGAEFEPMLVLSEELCPWQTSAVVPADGGRTSTNAGRTKERERRR
jgi:hypothetical protein